MDWGPIVTTTVSAFTGIAGAFFTWLAVRPKSHAEAGRTNADADYRSAEGFRLLVNELRQERVELAEVIERQGAKIEAQSEEITRLRGDVAGLKSTLEDMLTRWRRGDQPPPAEPKGNR